MQPEARLRILKITFPIFVEPMNPNNSCSRGVLALSTRLVLPVQAATHIMSPIDTLRDDNVDRQPVDANLLKAH